MPGCDMLADARPAPHTQQLLFQLHCTDSRLLRQWRVLVVWQTH
jgi:hypothetical protein